MPHLPLMLVEWRTGGGQAGLWAAMEWSGRWQMRFGATKMQQWGFRFQGGPNVQWPVLESGESLRLPPRSTVSWIRLRVLRFLNGRGKI